MYYKTKINKLNKKNSNADKILELLSITNKNKYRREQKGGDDILFTNLSDSDDGEIIINEYEKEDEYEKDEIEVLNDTMDEMNI